MTLHWGRLIHLVCCGNCGTRGPWADSESQALALWNKAHKRHNIADDRRPVRSIEQLGHDPEGKI
jgi:hypothetical protein